MRIKDVFITLRHRLRIPIDIEKERKSISPSPLEKRQHRFLNLRDYIFENIIKEGFKTQEIAFKPGVVITHHKSEAIFKKYNTFASPMKYTKKKYKGSLFIEYFTIKDGNKVDQRWISEKNKIPDFLWIPPRNPTYSYFEEDKMNDLWKVLGHCKKF